MAVCPVTGDACVSCPLSCRAAQAQADLDAQSNAQKYERRIVETPPQVALARIRVFLHDGTVHDIGIVRPWLDWMAQFLTYQGIVFDHGWVPLHTVKLIAPLSPEGVPEPPRFEGNVVPLKRPT